MKRTNSSYKNTKTRERAWQKNTQICWLQNMLFLIYSSTQRAFAPTHVHCRSGSALLDGRCLACLIRNTTGGGGGSLLPAGNWPTYLSPIQLICQILSILSNFNFSEICWTILKIPAKYTAVRHCVHESWLSCTWWASGLRTRLGKIPWSFRRKTKSNKSILLEFRKMFANIRKIHWTFAIWCAILQT